ncbi:response regulator transcription factor [Microvirga sp. KLBC 81]|uniref:LuxR C-terminal-related transcriptional regulator n=1 Tax=Microvirga sp. KLBC 81 TaxID=1862707 RepID=UPI001401F6DD|nr:response regulator transcription factor [Microvirga sp. KLBC 81]
MIVGHTFDPNFVRQGRDAGADGFCLSTTGRDVLIKSLELAMLGEAVLPAALVSSLLDDLPVRSEPGFLDAKSSVQTSPDLRVHNLSNREVEILKCLMQGASNKIIARQFDVVEATVKVHIKAILRKIGAANRTQAAMWATTRLSTGSSAAMSA